MIKLFEITLRLYNYLENKISNKRIINYSLLVPFFIIIIVALILLILGINSYDGKFYIMDFFNILDPYILNLGFLYYGGLIGYFISINSKDYIIKSTIYIATFLSIILVSNYFIKGLLENRLYISEAGLMKCLIPSISDEINISQLANFRVKQSIIGTGLDVSLYDSTKKLYYPRREYIKCGENNTYCDHYNYEQRIYNQLLSDYQEKCVELNKEKLGNLSGIKIISSGMNNKYFSMTLLNSIKKDGKLDLGKINELSKCIENKNGDIYGCLIYN